MKYVVNKFYGAYVDYAFAYLFYYVQDVFSSDGGNSFSLEKDFGFCFK